VKGPTKAEIKLAEANETLGDLCANPLRSIEAESEAAMYLKTKLKFTRQQIADFLGLSHRQVMTRLHMYALYAERGSIPTAEYAGRFGKTTSEETPREGVILDEMERQTRSVVTKIKNDLMRSDILQQRIVDACVLKLPSAANMGAVEELYAAATRTRSKTKGSEQTAIAGNSDLHLCLQNANHTFEDGMRANDNYVKKVIRLTDIQRNSFPVSKLHYNVLGDNLQGTANFPHQKWDVDRASIDQAEALAEVLVKNIQTYLIHFDELTVNLVWGNHAKIIQNNVDPLHSNWEQVAHKMVQFAFRDNPRVKFNFATTWWLHVDVMGTGMLLTHGDAAKGASGLDSIVNLYRKWSDILPPYDIAFQGHIHRFNRLALPRKFGTRRPRTLYIHGTAVKEDEHTSQFGGSPSNQWWIIFVNKERGVTVEYAADLYD